MCHFFLKREIWHTSERVSESFMNYLDGVKTEP